ncbi:MAG: hypothetical protein ACTHZD_14720 [Micrococcaceae bacterium]
MQLTSVVANVTPESISPTFNAPWMGFLGSIAGWAGGTALVVLVIVLVVGAVVWIASKLSSSGRGQDAGISIILWGLLAAGIVGAIGGLVGWAAGLPLI